QHSAPSTQHYSPPSISRREWRNVMLLGTLILLLTTLPYLIGWLSQTDSLRFNGFMFGTDDGNSYLAKMRLGTRGDWLFHIVYTSEPHDGAFVFAPYLIGGKIAGLIASPDSPALTAALLLVFHLARIVFGWLLILTVYRFVAHFLASPTLRLLTTALIALGGGLGWLLILGGQDNFLGSSPLDFIVPEGYTFYLLYGLPHLSLARIGLLSGLMQILDDRKSGKYRRALLAGACWLVMALCVPFYLAVLATLLGLWGIALWIRARQFPIRLFWRLLIAGLIPAPYLLYTLISFTRNPIMAAWQTQNLLPSPNPLHYIFGYGILYLAAILALRRTWRRAADQPAYLLLIVWIVAAPILAYLPLAVQRRMVEGMFVPLCILAIIGISRLRRWQPLAILIFALLLPSTALLLFTGAISAAQPAASNRLFSDSAMLRTLDWLNANAPADSVALSDAGIGNFIPAHTNLRAFVGHGPETIHFYEKQELARRLLAGEMTDQERDQLFADYNISYVIAPPESTLSIASDLILVYDMAGYRVYEVQQAE
ncbi:MAG: hypothetical protein KF726_19555, partial [Anaerolineae bacterium]|nr:hypothetical protein [Anaerolineae bacterium]